MASKEQIALTRRFFEDIFTGGNLSNLEEYVAKNVKLHDPSAPLLSGGIEEFRDREEMYIRAFPNKTATIEDIFSSGDKVAVRWTVTATHTGDLRGIPATGNDIEVTGIIILRYQKGKITEMWLNWDQLGLLEQLNQTHMAHAFQ